MQRGDLGDLLAFLAVARERSFTKAAAKLDVSQSALSQTISKLEARLGLRLLRRTTREHPAYTVLTPALARLVPQYPDIKIEVIVDYSLTDIAAERFDAGVRLGEQVAKDMIAVRIGPDLRMAVVGAPSYFADRPRPEKPQDLTAHNGINMRLPTHGGLFPWEFEKGRRELKVRVDGQLVFNSLRQRVDATLAGLGLAYLTCFRAACRSPSISWSCPFALNWRL